MIEIEYKGRNRTVWDRICSVWSDPFYYALRLPTVGHVVIFCAIFLSAISGIMIIVWICVKFLAHGIIPNISDPPPKLFIGCAVVGLFTLCAGIIHRKMTSPEFRGQFIGFSSNCWMEDDDSVIVCEVIDKRTTQLIGTRVSVDFAYQNIDNTYTFKTVYLGSPGLLVIPTEIKIPVENVVCEICGQADFVCIEALKAHERYFHPRTQTTHRRATPQYIKIRISGIDEVSGKQGTAEKVYESILPSKNNSSDGQDSNVDWEITSEVSTTHNVSSYVHVDFKFL